MRFTADTRELDAVEVSLGLAGLKMLPAAARQVHESAERVVGSAQQLVSAHERTGATEQSIHAAYGLGGLVGDVGPTTLQGARLERGTSHHPPYAYLGPALELEADAFRDGLAAAAMKSLM